MEIDAIQYLPHIEAIIFTYGAALRRRSRQLFYKIIAIDSGGIMSRPSIIWGDIDDDKSFDS